MAGPWTLLGDVASRHSGMRPDPHDPHAYVTNAQGSAVFRLGEADDAPVPMLEADGDEPDDEPDDAALEGLAPMHDERVCACAARVANSFLSAPWCSSLHQSLSAGHRYRGSALRRR